MSELGISRLYDAHLGSSYVKPLLRGWVHAASFVAAVLLGAVFIDAAVREERGIVAAVYAASVAGLFGTSAVYHRGRWTAAVSQRLQRMDHTMIIVMIAGTATPPMAWCLTGALRSAALLSLWLLAGTAILLRLAWISAPEKLVGSIYIGLGWIAGASLPAVWTRGGVAPALLLLVGGILYTVGALCYHRRSPNPNPAVFGYHEVFHLFVTLAAACHYVAIGCFLL